MPGPVPPVLIAGVEAITRTVRSEDGREIAWCEFGASRADCVVLWFHSGGSCRLEAALGHAVAMQAGVKIVCIDRPGVGYTSPWKTSACDLSDPARDAAVVLRVLGIKRHITAGFSAGAPHALAALRAAPEATLGTVLVNMTADRMSHAWKRQSMLMRAFAGVLLGPLRKSVLKAGVNAVRRDAARGSTSARTLVALLEEGGRQGTAAAEREIGLCYDHAWVEGDLFARHALALHGERDPNLGFVRKLAESTAWLSLETVPGGHVDGVAFGVWKRVCEAARGFSASPNAAADEAPRATEQQNKKTGVTVSNINNESTI